METPLRLGTGKSRLDARIAAAAWLASCAVILSVCAGPAYAEADATATSATTAKAGMRVSLALVAVRPALLEPGLAQGVALAWSSAPLWHSGGFALRWGADAGWDQAAEDSLSWRVVHNEVRLRAALEASWGVGVGGFIARIAGGTTWVHEARTRHQSTRLEGGAIEDSAWSLLPCVEAQLGAQLRIAGDLGMRLRAGPTMHFAAGSTATGDGVRVGFATALELAWLP